MAIEVILPALGMSQDTGKILRWFKAEGEPVKRSEPLVEIETDKATVEIEAPADGFLTYIRAVAGEEVPVGQVIAVISTPQEHAAQRPAAQKAEQTRAGQTGSNSPAKAPPGTNGAGPRAITSPTPIQAASSLASRIAAEHQVDLSQVPTRGRRIQKADVLAYLQDQAALTANRLVMASPKARRLAREQGKNLATINGTGPAGAVLAADVLAKSEQRSVVHRDISPPATPGDETGQISVSAVWRIMAERTAQSWATVPHFYLVREVNASRLVAWRRHLFQQGSRNITYTDLLVTIVAATLRQHPRINSTWSAGKITLVPEIHIGLAVAIEDGLVVPVIHAADTLNLHDLAHQREELVAKAQAGKLRPLDISEGTFTISNLGMYGVDMFNAIINPPQAAILAIGRIAERVVPLNGLPAVQPMLTLTLSCDHRAIDGARGGQFLSAIADLIEEPLGLLNEEGRGKREF